MPVIGTGHIHSREHDWYPLIFTSTFWVRTEFFNNISKYDDIIPITSCLIQTNMTVKDTRFNYFMFTSHKYDGEIYKFQIVA